MSLAIPHLLTVFQHRLGVSVPYINIPKLFLNRSNV
jgi:hypothetical protein